MKAIVLTCDKYHAFTDHMMHCYRHLWPENPFIFHVPYQQYPEHLKEKYGEKIRLIQSAPEIKSTMETLLKTTDAEEWVYWCMDDRYPVGLDTERVSAINRWVTGMDDEAVSGILFTYPMSKFTANYVDKHSAISDREKNRYVELIGYSHLWYHQFMRAKVLAHFTDHLPSVMSNAKQMDAIKNELTMAGHGKRYVAEKRAASFGESTNRGKITLNCLNSMKEYGLDVPGTFSLLDKEIVTGSRKYERSVLYYNVRSLYRKVLGIGR